MDWTKVRQKANTLISTTPSHDKASSELGAKVGIGVEAEEDK